MMFLSTPNRGSDLEDVLAKVLSVSLNSYDERTFSREIARAAEVVKALNDQFKKELATKVNILTYYETMASSNGPSTMVRLHQ